MLKNIAFRIVRVLLFCIASIFITSMAHLAKSKATQAKYISVEVDRADKKYLNDETAYFKVSLLNKPVNGILSLEVDAYYFEGSTKKNLNKLGDSTGSASRYSVGTSQNLTVTFDAYLVDKKQRESIGQIITKKTKQVSDLEDLITNNPDPDLIWRKETLEADLVVLNQKFAATKTKVQTEEQNLQVTPNDLNLVIISPVANSMFVTDEILVKGIFTSTIPDLELYVDGRQIAEAHSGELFSVEIHPENLGYSRFSVEIRRGARVLKKVLTDYGYVPPTSTLSNVGPAGGELEITSPESPIVGTKLSIPAGALNENESLILHEPYEYVPVPTDYVAVGSHIQVSPYLLSFNKDVELVIPIISSELSKSRILATQLEVLALKNGVWIKLPAVLDGSKIKVNLGNNVIFKSLSLVYAKTLNIGEMKIMSNLPTNKQIFVYLDEKLISTRTPVIAKSVPNGNRVVRLMADGYEEIVSKIEFANTGEYFFVFKPIPKVPPSNRSITLPVNYSTFDSVVEVNGKVEWPAGVDLYSEDLSYYVNGRHFKGRVYTNGNFEFLAPLVVGRNRITVLYHGTGGYQLRGSMEITRGKWNGIVPKDKIGKGLYNPNDDYLIVLNTEPLPGSSYGETHYLMEDSQGNKRGIWNHDYHNQIPGSQYWTHSLGQHAFSFDELPKEKYKISIKNLDGTIVPPEMVTRSKVHTMRIFKGGEIVSDFQRNFAYGDMVNDIELVSDGSQIEVSMATGLLNSSDLGDEAGLCVYPGRCTVARFLAGHGGEDKLLVGVDADPTIEDWEILFEITEVHTNTTVTSGSPMGRIAEITLPKISEQMRGANEGKFVREPVPPVTYKIVAKARGKKSEPFYVVQDQRSRIRQEYFDWKSYRQALWEKNPKSERYDLPIPTYEQIHNGSAFVKTGFYNWNDFVQDPWYPPGPLGFVYESQTFAETVAAKWAKLKKQGDIVLTITSGWRNPRKNAGLTDSSPNSGHLWGTSVDFAPPTHIGSLGIGHIEFKQYLKDLCEFVGKNLSGNIEVIVHNDDHVHIEKNKVRRVGCDSFKVK